MIKKKSKKKIRKKQKSIKDGFEQDQEEQEKENPKKGCSGSEVRAEQSSGFNRTRKSETDSRKNSRAVKCPHAQKKTENSWKKKFGNSPFCCLSHFSWGSVYYGLYSVDQLQR